jgi:L-histidine N-alpha-methyltransferase
MVPRSQSTVAPSSDAAVRDFALAVALGLSDAPRWIPARFLYDATGSALFEQISQLPEYYLTRTETTILAATAPEISRLTGPATLIELGSGNSVKIDHLLRAYARGNGALRYVPVDVNAAVLRAAAARIVDRLPSVDVTGVNGEYESAFPLLARYAPSLLLFLGSTVGNLNHAESAVFWRQVADAMPAGSHVLLGADLVKDPAMLHAAYNDVGGVTARFTGNLFARMNRELGAGLDLERIQHVARWNDEWQRVEIFGRFLSTQRLRIRPLDLELTISEGEHIMTEVSRKFVLSRLTTYLGCFGFRLVRAFTDERQWFAVLLLQKG